VRTSSELAPKGRPVPQPIVEIAVPEEAHAGRFLRLPYSVRNGTAATSAYGAGSDVPTSGHVGVVVRETEPGLCVQAFDFATPECVMVRKTIIIKVVPWEDEEPVHVEEE